MDTWMGNNRDPQTLHKYLYANADPINNIDPTGKFSLGQVMTAVNIAGTLASVASTSYDVLKMSEDPETFSAKDAGIAMLLSMGGSSTKLLKMVNKKLCKNRCKPPPILDYRHIFLGEIKRPGGKPIGYHSTADPSANVVIVSRSIPKRNGVYRAKIKVFNPNSGNHKKKSGFSDMFPDYWSRAMVTAGAYAAWNKGNGKQRGTKRVGNMKIRYYIHNSIWLRAHPVL